MADTLRNVDKNAHKPARDKFLSGEPGHGIKSATKLTKEAKERAEKLAAILAKGVETE